MSKEEMNIKIAEYMGFVGHIENGVELDYDMDWNGIMEVWQKLRGELEPLTEMVKKREYPPANLIRFKNRLKEAGEAILDTDITTAHRLIVEAIQLIKK